ncbi:hypothetical protein TRFO_14084 [Tritrichomonas foetus]|uniref:Vps16 N-terminal domain-containing protein n=1 Tax=Tritrichomonas foetus TaxID=1144522 RepID=A0A1J4KVX4_9EUKA|nr:hypothetical protein TRFO_14084 [Tritrichomonas foetus]|eukprot:OHT15465.1 hypothetical protein TRFO_14084 [Tritrichomonas foetus]
MITDISISPYHLTFEEISTKTGEFIESIDVFQWERLNNKNWDFYFFPDVERYTMGRGSGLISRDITSPFDSNSKPHVYLFDTYSNLVWDLIVDHRCNHAISKVFDNDNIAVMTDDGFFFCYQYRQLTMELDLKLDYSTTSVMAVDFWNDGFVCLLTNGDLLEARKFRNPRRIRHFESIGKPLGFFVLPPEISPTGQSIVYILDQSGKLLMATEKQCFTIGFESEITNIAPSASFSKIALLTSDFNIIVTSYDLQELFYKRQVENTGYLSVTNLSWVGDTSPVVCFKGAVILVNDDSTGQAMWTLDSEDDFAFGFTDSDSCLICTSGPTYRLKNVPRNIFNIFDTSSDPDYLIGNLGDDFDTHLRRSSYHEITSNTNHARRLCETFDKRLETPPIQAVTAIGPNDIISQAAKDCLEAAEYFEDSNIQDFFLNVACFAFTYMGNTTALFESVTRIKILNMVRKIANIPTTSTQVFDIGIDSLIMRLMNRELHFIAMDIAHILHKPTTSIQKQYVDRAMKTILDDNICFNTINDHKDIDFGYAAVSAAQNKRQKLALEFCKLEPHFSRKAIIFAQIGEWAEALRHADAACDSSALFNALVILFDSPEIENVNLAVSQSEVASMYIVNNYGFVDSVRTQTILQMIDPKSIFEDAKFRAQLWENEVPTCLQSALKPQIKLEECQKPVAIKKNDPSIVGKSFNDTIRQLLSIAEDQLAFDFAKSVGIPKVNVAVLGIQHLSRLGRWNRLKMFILHKEWSSLWPFVIEIALSKCNEEFAMQFAEEVATREHNRDLINQLQSGAFGVSNLATKPSYQKKLFRKSFFKPFL